MAGFTHPAPDGSRFADGSFGTYYAAEGLDTAVAETAHHMGRFYGDSAEEPGLLADMRVYVGAIRHSFHDIREGHDDLHDPDSYVASKAFAHALREAGSDGVVYRSVRRPGGECVAAFWPDVVEIPSRRGTSPTTGTAPASIATSTTPSPPGAKRRGRRAGGTAAGLSAAAGTWRACAGASGGAGPGGGRPRTRCRRRPRARGGCAPTRCWRGWGCRASPRPRFLRRRLAKRRPGWRRRGPAWRGS
ncbi:MAG: RES family NAD+ phosphorylase [Myxococcota bacterium]